MEDIFHLGIKALVRDSGGNILLLQVNPEKLHGERKNYWDLPGGRLQKGDTVIDTLRREVEEETGITDLQNPEEIGMVLANIRIPIRDNESAGLILNIYSCQIALDVTITLSDEHIAYDWFSPSETAKLLAVKYSDKFCELIATL